MSEDGQLNLRIASEFRMYGMDVFVVSCQFPEIQTTVTTETTSDSKWIKNWDNVYTHQEIDES